ncbi:hypothetical protein B296_00046259 [Ensete ventricosum]|uniref:Uncharacterized protein n=1 Tax=Ensete ventricosum TaxID=4639 RepID=A0A426YEE7_ENSVE|nr:hypothetical protein B296_00046259 [Ensete ventricosum]
MPQIVVSYQMLLLHLAKLLWVERLHSCESAHLSQMRLRLLCYVEFRTCFFYFKRFLTLIL